MPDETPAPDATPRAAVRAGGTLDLSTGPAAPPPPPPAPLPPAPADSDVRAGRTLNLSTGRAPSGKPRKADVHAVLGSGPVIRETLDLSTEKPPAPAPAPTAEAPSGDRQRSGGPKQGRTRGRDDGGSRGGRGTRGGSDSRGGSDARGTAPASSSESLADLLSPEMLAKLRGG